MQQGRLDALPSLCRQRLLLPGCILKQTCLSVQFSAAAGAPECLSRAASSHGRPCTCCKGHAAGCCARPAAAHANMNSLCKARQSWPNATCNGPCNCTTGHRGQLMQYSSRQSSAPAKCKAALSWAASDGGQKATALTAYNMRLEADQVAVSPRKEWVTLAACRTALAAASRDLAVSKACWPSATCIASFQIAQGMGHRWRCGHVKRGQLSKYC